LIVPVIALGLLALAADVAVPPVGQGSSLTIDPCVEVDEATVREVMDLELGGVHGDDETRPAAVFVGCVADGQEIRIEPWASSQPGGARIIRLSPADGTLPVARAARSRELALAIAEIIRRRATAPAPPPEAVPPSAPSVPATPSVSAPPAHPTRPTEETQPDRWQLGVSPTYDYFDGGKRLAGGDLFMGARLGRWLLAEVRAGGRIAAEQAVPGGSLSAHATTVGVAIGVLFWPASRRGGAALMLRAQEYWVQFRLGLDDGRTHTSLLGALALAAEPRLIVALTHRWALAATAGIGFLPHGIIVRTQGVQTQSVSGLVLSASLAGVFTF
jgi:hypothetical protein